MDKTDEAIIKALSSDPKTPFELSKELGLHQATVQKRLLELHIEKPGLVGYRKIGRYHMFWLKK
ncbi:MAG: AsnC family protein [Thaumarchaeota archaeon]|nr:AsnC family protein [Nitrososphaerota archaeon]